ncbi:MAG TPA: hypothetical protein H9677_03185 [Firmicutes bacterium]|nr:hypothetical protein [Bacillota bacterium]
MTEAVRLKCSTGVGYGYCSYFNEFPFYKLNLTSDGLYLSGADGFSSFLDMAGCDRVTVAYYGNYFSDPGAQFFTGAAAAMEERGAEVNLVFERNTLDEYDSFLMFVEDPGVIAAYFFARSYLTKTKVAATPATCTEVYSRLRMFAAKHFTVSDTDEPF